MTLDELLASTQSGDPLARDALTLALYARLRSFFRRRCNQALEVEDMVQITLEAIVRAIDSFVPTHPKAFEYLVYDTARRILSTKRRSSIRQGRWRADITPAGISTDTSPSVRAMRRELLEHLAEVISKLDSTERRTIADWLASIDWRVQVEREGVARGTLRVRLSRALRRVRALLRRANSTLFPEVSKPSTT